MTYTVNRVSADLAAATLTPLIVPAGANGTYLVNLCNRINAPNSVRIAITSGAAPGVADYIEYDTPLSASQSPAGGVLSRFPVPLQAGWRVYVWALNAGVSATLIGIKEGT